MGRALSIPSGAGGVKRMAGGSEEVCTAWETGSSVDGAPNCARIIAAVCGEGSCPALRNDGARVPHPESAGTIESSAAANQKPYERCLELLRLHSAAQIASFHGAVDLAR